MEDVAEEFMSFAQTRQEHKNFIPSNFEEIISNEHFIDLVVQLLHEDIDMHLFHFIYEIMLIILIEYPQHFQPNNYSKIIFSYFSFIQTHGDEIVQAADEDDQSYIYLIEQITDIIAQLIFYGLIRYNYFSDFPAKLKEKLSFQEQANFVFHLGVIAQFAKLMEKNLFSEDILDIPYIIRIAKPTFIEVNRTMLEIISQTNFEYKSMYGEIIFGFYQAILHSHPIAKEIFTSINDIPMVVFEVFPDFIFDEPDYLDVFYHIFALHLTRKSDPSSYIPFFKFFQKMLSNAELIYSDDDFFFKFTTLLHDFCESTRFVAFAPDQPFLKSLEGFTQYINQVSDPKVIILLTKIWTYFPKEPYSKQLCLDLIKQIENSLSSDTDLYREIGIYEDESLVFLGYFPKLFEGYDSDVCKAIIDNVSEKIESIENHLISNRERVTISQVLAFRLELIVTTIKKNMHESISSELMNIMYKIIDIEANTIYRSGLFVLDYAIAIAINFITSSRFRNNAKKSGINFIKICGMVFPRVEAALEKVTDVNALPIYINTVTNLKPHPIFEEFALTFLDKPRDNLLDVSTIVPMIGLTKEIVSVIWKDNQTLLAFSEVINHAVDSAAENKVLLILVLIGMANYCKEKRDFVIFVQWLMDEKMENLISLQSDIEQELVFVLIIDIITKPPEVLGSWKLDKGLNLNPPILRSKNLGIEELIKANPLLFVKLADLVIPFALRLSNEINEFDDPQRLSILIFNFFTAIWEYTPMLEFYRTESYQIPIFKAFEEITTGLGYDNIYNNPTLLTSFMRLAPKMASVKFPVESRVVFNNLFNFILEHSAKDPEILYTSIDVLKPYLKHQNGAIGDLRDLENQFWKNFVESDTLSTRFLIDAITTFIIQGSMLFIIIINSFSQMPNFSSKIANDFIRGIRFEANSIMKKKDITGLQKFLAKLRDFCLNFHVSYNRTNVFV